MRIFPTLLLAVCIGFAGGPGCLLDMADSDSALEVQGTIRKGRPLDVPIGVRQVFAFYASAFYAETQGQLAVFASELHARIRAGETLFIIDVRDPVAYQRGHVPTAINISIDELFTDEVMDKLPVDGTPVVVVCESGHVGSMAASLLGAMGYNAYMLRFGMVGWNRSTPVQFYSPQQFPQTITGLNGPMAN